MARIDRKVKPEVVILAASVDDGAGLGQALLLWAKLKKAGSQAEKESPRWHPLFCHMVDVALVAQTMWELMLQPSTRFLMAKALRVDESIACSWVGFMAGSHDIGKATPSFEGKWDEVKQMLNLVFRVVFRPTPHGIATASILPGLLEEIGVPRQSAQALAISVGGHHGVFPRPEQWVDLGTLHLGDKGWGKVRRDLFDYYMKGLELPTRTPPAPSPEAHVFFLLLAGLTTIADWIGSSEVYFPLQGEVDDIKEYISRARENAEHAVRSLGWHRWDPCTSIGFVETFGFPPNQMQNTVISIAQELKGPSLVIVEAPMGLGKTEAALWMADMIGMGQDHAGWYVALPTEATSNQMFDRVKKFLSSRYPQERVNLHLAHSHAALSEAYQDLRLASIADEKPGDGVVVAEEWFTPKKRALLAPFAVGTVDQALMSVLRVKHGFVRMFGLAGRTVIIDEVHAYDTYTSTLLDHLLSWLSALGSSVILLSATLPRSRRCELIEAYCGRYPQPEETPYPRVTLASSEKTASVGFELQSCKLVKLVKMEGSLEDVARKAISAIGGGGCLAWICNTVDRAQQVYLTLRDTIARISAYDPSFILDLDLFHARYPYEERKRREDRVLKKFGKDSSHRPPKAILVATQVIEQSLDLDFDLMVTDVAPVDLVLQRAGRIHRHLRSCRPVGVGTPCLWLLVPDQKDGAPDFKKSVNIYPEYLLLRSWLFLEERRYLTVPEDIDALVQRVYDPSFPLPQGTSLENAKRLQGLLEKMEEERGRQRSEALVRLIKHPHCEESILESFDAYLEEDDPTVHQAFQALTRQGISVEVVCLHEAPDGVSLKPDGSGVIDLQRIPGQEMIRELLQGSIRLSHQGLVRHILDQEVPTGWRKSPFLRHHRVAIFSEGVCDIGNWRIIFSTELGLVVQNKGGEKNEP